MISVLIVDDISETRENIKKLLAFEEQEFRVVGSVGTGREAVRAAIETKPDIVIMDINMPDMDGIQATAEITKVMPTSAVIMMSVQTDADYMRKAMQAGARQFLGKPVDMDELYSTIRAVYKSYDMIRRQAVAMSQAPMLEEQASRPKNKDGGDARAGHIIVVYSPQGGAGCTTIATNLASGLMRNGKKVLIVDSDIQFGNVGVFLKLQASATMLELVANIDDIDTEFFDSVASSHESGLKALLAPQRPEYAEEVEAVPEAIARIVGKVAGGYDFVVVDTRRRLDEGLLALFDIASKILLVVNPTLPCVKNTRFVVDLFDQLSYSPDKSVIVINRVDEERGKGRVTLPDETIEKHLKKQIIGRIPNNEMPILGSINKGVPLIATRDRTKSPVREFMELADAVYERLMGNEVAAEDDKGKKRGGLFGRN